MRHKKKIEKSNYHKNDDQDKVKTQKFKILLCDVTHLQETQKSLEGCEETINKSINQTVHYENL